LTELVLSQLTDVFRIGLIIGLVFTMHRTAAVTGRVLPLAVGVLFLAVMLPVTMPNPSVRLVDAIVAGMVSNTIILAPVLGVAWLIARSRR
jgi:drug/metabolite transporter (DMT)-like permease